MEETALGSLTVHFGDLDDPRQASGRRHKLLDIIAIAICATICGADNWVAMAAFGRANNCPGQPLAGA